MLDPKEERQAAANAIARTEVTSYVLVAILEHLRAQKMQIHPQLRQQIATQIAKVKSSQETDWFLERIHDAIQETPLERETKRETPRTRGQ